MHFLRNGVSNDPGLMTFLIGLSSSFLQFLNRSESVSINLVQRIHPGTLLEVGNFEMPLYLLLIYMFSTLFLPSFIPLCFQHTSYLYLPDYLRSFITEQRASKMLLKIHLAAGICGILPDCFAVIFPHSSDSLFNHIYFSICKVWDMRTKSNVHTLTGHTSTIANVQCQGAEPQVSCLKIQF